MSEKPIDPRYSSAFQRRPDGSVGESENSRRLPPRSSLRETRPAASAGSAAASSTTADSSPVPAPGTSWSLSQDRAEPPAEADRSTFSESADDEADREAELQARRWRLFWTIALFVIGIGLCALSFACYVEYTSFRFTDATPISGTDQFVISDGTGAGTRIVDRFEVLFPRYMSQMAVWIGAVGLATIVVNLFRVAAGRSRS